MIQFSDVQELLDLAPAQRGLRFLKISTELKKRKSKAEKLGALPSALKRESIIGTPIKDVISTLHGIAGVTPRKVTGLRETGRRLKTKAGIFSDLVTGKSRVKS